MIDIEIYEDRDPRAIRVNFGKKCFIINEYGRIEQVGYIDYNGDPRGIVVLIDPFGSGR